MKKINLLIALTSLFASVYCYSYSDNAQMCPQSKYPDCPSSLDPVSSSTASSLPTCINCPAGTAANGDDKFSANKNFGCKVCMNGYTNDTGSITCKSCPDGYQCLNSAILPQPCPKGFARSILWTRDDFDNGGCKRCPIGTYANKVGSARCLPCPSGYYCRDPTDDPVPCPKGTATEIGQASFLSPYDSQCKQCPSGYYASSVGSSRCTLCPAGYYCPDPTRAVKCPLGTYRDNIPYQANWPNEYNEKPMDSSNCVQCPKGSYASTEGSSSCKICPMGYYCPEPTSAPKKCPLGTYSNLDSGAPVCTPCPNGFYASVLGSTKCTECPNGYQCQDQTVAPKKCPLGQYSDSTIVKDMCIPCPEGTFANVTGMTFCYNCPDSKCCDDPTANPTTCTYSPVYTSSTLNPVTSSF